MKKSSKRECKNKKRKKIILNDQNIDLNNLFKEKKYNVITEINDEYVNNYDITYIHNKILKLLDWEIDIYSQKLLKKIENIEEKLLQPSTYIVNCTYNNKLKILKEKYQNIISKQRLNEYLKLSKPLLNEYKKYNKVENIYYFIENENENISKEDQNEINHRIYIIDQYFELASNYIKINIIRKIEYNENCCINCNLDLEKIATDMDGIKICPECSTEHKIIQLTKMTKEFNYSPHKNENNNFYKAFLKYQGIDIDNKFNDSNFEELEMKLDEFFTQNKRLKGKEIRNLPSLENGKKPDTNHKMMYQALSITKNSQYYEETNYICVRYWGWKLHDLMYLKSTIQKIINEINQIYPTIPIEIKVRVSNLGTQYMLYKVLRALGHPCSQNEFKIPEDNDSIQNQEKIWKIICENMKDPKLEYLEN